MDEQTNNIRPERPCRNLPVWRKGMDLAVRVLHLIKKWPEEDRDVISPDALRSAILVPCNIEMGYESDSMSEFFEHLDVARGKLGRLRSLLIMAQQLGYYSLEEYEELANDIAEIRLLVDKLAQSPRGY